MPLKPRDFFKKVDKKLLEEYFIRNAFPILVTVSEATPVEFEAALYEMPNDKLKDALGDLTDLEDLADDFGLDAVLKAAFELGEKEVPTEIGELKGFHNQLLHVLINYRAVFLLAVRNKLLQKVKITTERSDISKVDLENLKGKETVLADSIRQFLIETDGRGQNCHAESYFYEEGICFILYPEGHTKIDLRYEGTDLARYPTKPAMRIIYFYYPQEGKLQISAPFRGKKLEKLLNIFNEDILGDTTDISGANNSYKPAAIFDKDFKLEYDAKDMVRKLYLKDLKFKSKATGEKVSVTLGRFEMEPKGTKEMMEILEKRNITKEEFEVVSATIYFEFYSPIGKGVVNAVVTASGCSLSDGVNEKIARKYLEKWGLVSQAEDEE